MPGSHGTIARMASAFRATTNPSTPCGSSITTVGTTSPEPRSQICVGDSSSFASGSFGDGRLLRK
jgi:hypothetical protein